MRLRTALIVALASCSSPIVRAAQAGPSDPKLIAAMEAELDRSMKRLRNAGSAPIYFLAYRVYETETVDVAAAWGALESTHGSEPTRWLDVELRVGSPALDNTHKLRRTGWDYGGFYGDRYSRAFPMESDEAAIRAALWESTDAELKRAQKKLTEIKANRSVSSAEEDPSPDFSLEKPSVHFGEPVTLSVDRATWEKRARELSLIFREEAAIQSGAVYFSAHRVRRTLVSSEGTRIQDDRVQYRITLSARAVSDDGMMNGLYDDIEAPRSDLLPSDDELKRRAKKLAAEVRALRTAPLAEPYVGPAILSPRAAGVFFHEVFGHRMEGHRLKSEEEGRTYKGKIGRRVMPEFISVVDDPTREKLGEVFLNGFYGFDDEGVRSEKVSLVDRGVLKSFLLSRSPVEGFPRSNGHGRATPGSAPVARQGNLIVESSKRIPRDRLRAMLLEELRNQDKPYGLLFDQIEGGFTYTQTAMPQAFKVLPLRVLRIHVDGRPDEVVRGVDIVGTPLTSLERILATGDDEDVFNGQCGAESGYVPVSAASPSLLVATIETERRAKTFERPPILPPPDPKGGDVKKKGGAK
jgi:TldD protein